MVRAGVQRGFCEVFKKHSAGGKSSLRRQQFALAMKGNAAMLIWLGKQYLGQADKPNDNEPEMSEQELNDALGEIIQRSFERLIGDSPDSTLNPVRRD